MCSVSPAVSSPICGARLISSIQRIMDVCGWCLTSSTKAARQDSSTALVLFLISTDATLGDSFATVRLH